jgi:predicted dehydrogenase
MPTLPRRAFVARGAATAVVAPMIAAAGTHPAGGRAANDTVVVGVVGLGGQGRAHAGALATLPNVAVAYLCDVDAGRLEAARPLAPEARLVDDLRRILDDRGVDAVSIATPDHWHVPAALLALTAGKHVYVEKPCSHNVREGRWLVDAVARTGRVLQHGTQSRSSPFIQAAVRLLREGVIGTVQVARAWNVQERPSIGRERPGTPPAGFDYDTWLGPAPACAFQKNRHHYTWHWWHDFGTGDAGNDGVHELDIARWGLGVDTHPSQVVAVGGKYVLDDDQQFPDTMTAVFDYPGDGVVGRRRQLIFEMRLWSRSYPHNISNGNEFLGTSGRMLLTKRGKLEVFDDRGRPLELETPKPEPASLGRHQADFIDAIRSGAAVRADAVTGHLSASLPHLANLACRMGRGLRFDPSREAVVGDEEADRLLGRVYREHWSRPAQSVAPARP